MITQKLGLRIRQLRQERGMSQEELSFLAELDRTYITSVENGRRNISIINIEKIAKAFSMSIKDLFDF